MTFLFNSIFPVQMILCPIASENLNEIYLSIATALQWLPNKIQIAFWLSHSSICDKKQIVRFYMLLIKMINPIKWVSS